MLLGVVANLVDSGDGPTDASSPVAAAAAGLEIVDPLDGTVVNNGFIQVRGTAPAGSEIVLDRRSAADRHVTVAHDGTWVMNVDLQVGLNELMFWTVSNPAAALRLRVVYEQTASAPTPNAATATPLPSSAPGPTSAPSPTSAPTPSLGWTATGDMITPRYGHTATLLPNGAVLVAGGVNNYSGPTATAELYDPASGTWTATQNVLAPRYGHTATLLPNGTVLVAGGSNRTGTLYSAELYDPASGTWTATGSIFRPRAGHTATLLPNGAVLMAGGLANFDYPASAELYDPASGLWTTTGSMISPRGAHTATLLPNGAVLVVGGSNRTGTLYSAELYDPASGLWTAAESMTVPRAGHRATLLPNGKVLVAGGSNESAFGFAGLASAELYDPASRSWTPTGSMLTPRSSNTATMLPNGTVLVTGGSNYSNFDYRDLASAEWYDPASRAWTATGSMITRRYQHSATLLLDGSVLVAGGNSDKGMTTLTSAELYTPTAGRSP